MTPKRRDIFLHFLNRDSRQIYGLFSRFGTPDHDILLGRAVNAAAILCETNCVAPPGFVVECDIAQAVMERKSALLRERLIVLPMRETSLADFVEKKRRDYAPIRGLYEGLFNDEKIRFLADHASGLVPRQVLIGENIAKTWLAGPDESKRIWKPAKDRLGTRLVESIRGIPRQLIENEVAATWPAIVNFLPVEALQAEAELRRILQHDYFGLYVKEFNLVILRNIAFMRDDFGLPSEPRIYDYYWLSNCLRQISQTQLLDADAETLLLLRSQHGFIRFIDAYSGLCRACSTPTDLAFHINYHAHSFRFDLSALSSFWAKNPWTQEYELPNSRIVELADALGKLAIRIEVAFSLPNRLSELARRKTDATPRPRATRIMDEQEPKLAIFVALDEEYEILKRRWTLVRDFAEHRARGRINSVPVDVISANGMGRVPAAVTTGYYLAHRRSGMPLLILVVGLAGGFQEEGIEEGMVIVSDRVIDLATRKVRDKKAGTQTEFRRRDFPLDGTIHDFVTSTDFDQAAWEREAIEVGEWPSSRRPSLHFGSLTSLDEVVSSTKLRKEILNDTPKLLGVEMEAAGVCAAADRYKVPVAMIRAISDKSDPSKKDNAWRSRGIKTIAILIEMLDLAAITSRLESNK